MDFEKIIYSAVSPILGAAFGYLSGSFASAKKSGALENEVSHIREDLKEHKTETGSSFADVHERISASKAIFTKGLDDVNVSFIQIMKETAEIKGILIGKGVIK